MSNITGDLLKDYTNQEPTRYRPRYGDKKLLEELLIGKRLKSVYKDKMVLEDETIITIECSEQDCCAGADGAFEFSNWNNENLDAVITNIKIHEPIEVPDNDTHVVRNTISVFNNQNVIALANATADAGNGGYYYSVASLVINEIHFPFVEA